MRSLLAFLLFAVASASAQPLLVTAASPADYAANVATETTISFTFSEPLVDITQGFGTAPVLVTLPTGAVTITGEEQSADLQTVTYTVSLPDDERVVFLVLDALAADGDRLARPFALNLITSGSAGGLTFSGEVSTMDGGSAEGALVALVTGDFETGAIEFVGVDVIEGDGASEPFSFPAPFGFYTIGAVRLPFPAPEALAYGFYDPNGDGTPDILLSQSGNDVTLAPPDPITAGEPIADAQSTAEAEVPGARLTGIAPSLVNEAGQGRAWRYRFEGDTGVVEVVSVGLFSLPIPSIDDQLGFDAFPVPFRDSDAALAEADLMGGAAFRTQQEGLGRMVTVTMRADPVVAQDPEWSVVYAARQSEEGEPLATESYSVPLVFSTTLEPDPRSGPDLRVHSNPTRGALRLAVTLGEADDVSVTLVDLRGRVLASLHDGWLLGGETTFSIPITDLPAGSYLVRLQVSSATRAVPVSILR